MIKYSEQEKDPPLPLEVYPNILLGLALFEASPYEPRPVSQSVCPSVCDKSSHTSRHRIFLIFCNKLAFNECRKVTKPDF